jgi:hypothetical protein
MARGVMRLAGRWAALTTLVLGTAGGVTRAATPEDVEAAIHKGVDFLYTQQKLEGNWEEVQKRTEEDGNSVQGAQWGGLTAMATYGLLAAGQKPTDPRLQKGIDFLLKADDMVGIYAIGVRAQVWTFLPQDETIKKAIKRDAKLLFEARDASTGRYGYRIGPERELIHNSSSQYGVLGMWACVDSGVVYDMPRSYWASVENGWKTCQGPDGGWQYFSDKPKVDQGVLEEAGGQENPSGSMTAAGIATLFITQDFLRSNDGIECRGNITNPSIEAGLTWMAKNYDPGWTDGYFLYGVERIGVASGIKYFGTHDWFDAGSTALVRGQAADGGFGGNFGGPVANTAFSILFLVRGRAPVAINKLEYNLTRSDDEKKAEKPVVGPWNERPRDIANVTRYLTKQTEADLNWQIVTMDSTPEALLEAPILYISGNRPLEFTAAEQDTLRRYVQRGGLILGNADGGSAPFADSFRKLAKTLFPDSEAREVPADSSLYTSEAKPRATWATKPHLEGWTNGVREQMLLFASEDPAKYWQLRGFGPERAPFSEIMIDLLQYATDKQKSRVKGQSYLVEADPEIQDTVQLKLARLEYKGNWDPEPGGWVQFKNVLHNTQKIGLEVETVKLGEGKLSGYKLAHLTGTGTVSFDEKQMSEIKSFVSGGGILIIDAAGGNTEFATSLNTQFASANLNPLFLDKSESVISGQLKGVQVGIDCSTVKYRHWAMKSMAKTTAPRLRAQSNGGHKTLFFSEEDLSAGLVNNQVDGIKGYEPAAASNLMTNIMLYAAGKLGEVPPPPPPPPAATGPASAPATSVPSDPAM